LRNEKDEMEEEIESKEKEVEKERMIMTRMHNLKVGEME
jgi:hypothetical protein